MIDATTIPVGVDVAAAGKKTWKKTAQRAWNIALLMVGGAGVMLVAITLMLLFGAAEQAEAWPWSDIPWVGPALDWAIGGSDPLSEFLSAPLREMLNGILALQITMLGWFSTDNLLVGTFDTLFSGISPSMGSAIYNMVANVHHVAVMPLAYVVLIACFCFRLYRLLYDMNAHDSGIDLLKMSIVFVVFFFTKAVIDNSWELMAGLYGLFTNVTQSITVGNYVPEAAGGQFSEEFSNVGMLMWMFVPLTLGLIILWACTMIAKVTLIARIAQIYLYAAFSPIPIAQALTDSGRTAAFTFGKKFAALVLSAAVMLVLFNMLALCMQSMATVYIQVSQATDPQGMLDAMTGYMMSFVVLIAFTMLIGKSGKLSQDILGVG